MEVNNSGCWKGLVPFSAVAARGSRSIPQSTLHLSALFLSCLVFWIIVFLIILLGHFLDRVFCNDDIIVLSVFFY